MYNFLKTVYIQFNNMSTEQLATNKKKSKDVRSLRVTPTRTTSGWCVIKKGNQSNIKAVASIPPPISTFRLLGFKCIIY